MKKLRKKKGKDQKAYAADSGTLLRFAASPGFIPAFLMILVVILVFLGAGAGFTGGSEGAVRLRAAVSEGTLVSPEGDC